MMTFTREDMLEAAYAAIETQEVGFDQVEKRLFLHGFDAGSSWAASKMESDDDNELDRLLREGE